MIKVPGFLSSSIYVGIKKKGGKDFGLIFSKVPAKVAGVFTTNVVKAAPVILGMERIKNGYCQAIVVNSGNANACTGKRGFKDASLTASLVARELGIRESLVIPSSTGVIGVPLPIQRIKSGVSDLVSKLSEDGLLGITEAMMTTDLFPKYTTAYIRLGSKVGTICALGKGAGMIAPQMATMLCFILTDVNIQKAALNKALLSAVENSFNKIIVDGDTSTNDTVLMLSNGTLGNEALRIGDKYYSTFQSAVNQITTQIANMIVKDGEGATKVVKIIVKGAKNEKDASKIANTIGTSLLVKTAFYGEDPNWGRLIAAAGRAGVKFDPQSVDLFFGEYKVVKNGIEVLNENIFQHVMKSPNFTITLDLKNGKASSFVITSDITMDYLKLNSHYRT
ncbi:MAG: bifunctional glutamate N-acetyltransferase/amino-acid acetyltransferase ArgJ [Thermodesulfobacteriota bacterium]